MLVVGQEVVIDLTDETGDDNASVIHRAKTTALNDTVMELTLVYHLDAPFFVKELAQMLSLAPNLEYFSLFSVALNGTSQDFDNFAKVLREHKGLKEVHMIDCGMYGAWEAPPASGSIPSYDTGNETKDNSSNGGTNQSGTNQAMTSICSTAPPTMDVILEAIGSIQTLENVELYGIPSLNFGQRGDDANESDHGPVPQEGEGEGDMPMVPMAMDDSVTYSDEDYMDDYDEDMRGIPGNKSGPNKNSKLSLLMSPTSIGALCRAPSLTNVGLEDLNLQDEHIMRMMQSLSMTGNTIKELKIWGCNIADKACTAIAKMLQVNKTLERLDLANNHIDDAGCILIANALHGNTTLVSLNLMGNECAQNYDAVSVGGAYEALLDLLEKNKTLTDLVLEPYEQDDEADVPEYIIIPATTEIDVNSSASNSVASVESNEHVVQPTLKRPKLT